MPDGMTGTDLIPRATLEALLGHRDRALALAMEARALHHRQTEAMNALLRDIHSAVSGATVNQGQIYKLSEYITDKYDDEAKFAAKVRRDLDAEIWPAILTITGLAGIMDKQARSEFDRELASNPPECTADNIRATFRALKEDAHRIFRRGLVNVFKNLSREYRSHDGFKLGPRTVIQYGVGDHREYHTFADADRIMQILDGMRVGPGWYSVLAHRLRDAVKTEWRQRSKWSSTGDFVIVPGELSTAYWRVKWYQNQNVHLWCLRPDLLRRANRLIAEHFEEALGAGPDAAGARKYHRAKPHHHEVEDFYPTPPDVVARIIRAAALRPSMEVLEPSAGNGAIVAGLLREGINPDAVEIDADRAEILRDMLPPGAVVEMDFLRMHPEPEYDRVLMNPPFGKGAGIQHVLHALRFLKPGGRLVAVLGAGLEYREDGPTRELRALVQAWDGTIERLPPASFRASGTEVETVLLTITKPAGALPALPAPDAASQENLFA